MSQKTQLEISVWTIIKVVLVLLGFYFFFYIRDIFVFLLVVLILAATFRPIVNRWEKKIRRLPAVIALLLIAAAILAFIGYIVIPPIISQITSLVQNFPTYVDRLSFFPTYKNEIVTGLKSLSNNITGISGGFVSITSSIFGGVFTFLSAIVLTVYLLLDKDGFHKLINSVVQENSRETVTGVARKISYKMGSWLRGQLLLSLIIAVIDYLGLLAIGVPYALVLAIIAGLLEFIPVVGPFTSGAIAAIVALTISPVKALLVVILYLLVQQLENNIIVPKIMQKAVGLSPVIIIVAILIGVKVIGLFGALLAVPIAAVISVIISEWPAIKASFGKDE